MYKGVKYGKMSKTLYFGWPSGGEILKLTQKTKNDLHLELIWSVTKIDVLAQLQLILQNSIFRPKLEVVLAQFCNSVTGLSWSLKNSFLSISQVW